jgi:glycerol-1-phosphate dehydrogenase [NAD(P)+]
LTLVRIEAQAARRLPSFVGGPALVVMDLNTREALGELVARELAAGTFVFERRSGLLAGTDEAEAVQAALPRGAMLVAVGSGVITDIVRYAALLAGVDFVSVPTAASMDGYASSGAAMQVEGVKVTYQARPPRAVLADPVVCAAAPAELTRAGIGDLLAKVTARVDWLAAHLLYGEDYRPEIANRVLGPLGIACRAAQSALRGEVAPVQALLEGLIESGLAMSQAGSSRPASGCEHHASHYWDLLAARGLRPHASHGLQVGYATRFAMALQRFAYGGGVAGLQDPAPIADPPPWMASPVVDQAMEAKRRFVARGFRCAWEDVLGALRPELARFEEVEHGLDAAGIPSSTPWLGIDADMLRDAFRFGSRLRARYTVVDFLEGQGLLEEAIEGVLTGPSISAETGR